MLVPSRAQRRAGVEAEPGRSGDEGIIGEAGIQSGVFDDQRSVLGHGHVAEGAVPVALRDIGAELALEPDAVFFDEGHEGDRRVERGADNSGDPVEGFFRRRVDNGVLV